MSEGYGDLERARQHVDPAWSPRKLEQELARLDTQLETRKGRPFVAVFAVALSAASVAALLWSQAPAPRVEPVASRVPAQLDSSAGVPAKIPVAEPNPAVAAADDPRAKTQKSATTDSQVAETQTVEAVEVRTRSVRVKVAGTAWRSLAREGRYREAYSAMRGSEPDRVRAEVDELLLAGDAARLSGHAREAEPYYRAALDKAGTGPRAHLAAFTLGRTLLNDLHDPQNAALAFARAYKVAPRGPLAEEALAREAESWKRAGDVARAQGAIERYEATYPQGRLIKR